MTSNIVNFPPSDRVSRRRQELEDKLRAEGASEGTVARLATDDLAAQMVDYESRAITSIFQAVFPSLFRGGKELG